MTCEALGAILKSFPGPDGFMKKKGRVLPEHTEGEARENVIR